MALIPIQNPATASPFSPPLSHPASPRKGTPQASHNFVQRLKIKFLQEKHISSLIHPNNHYNLIPALTEGPPKLKPRPNRNIKPPQKYPSSPSVVSAPSASRLNSTFTVDLPSPNSSSPTYDYKQPPSSSAAAFSPELFASAWDSTIAKANFFVFLLEIPTGKSLEVIHKCLMEPHQHIFFWLGFDFSSSFLLLNSFASYMFTTRVSKHIHVL